jgi:hypothetical protein
MEFKNSANEKLSLRKRIEADESTVPVEEQTVAANLEDPEGLLRSVAEESADDNLDRRLSPRTDSRGSEWKYDFTRDPEMEPGRRRGETLAGQEKRLGREAEQKRHGEVVRAGHSAGDERAKASRMVEDEREWHRYDVATEEAAAMPLSWVEQADLTGTVSDEVASQVRRQAGRIHERVEGSPSEGLLRRWIVERVRRGQDLIAAVDDVHREAQRWNGATQTISTIRWGDRTATIEVEVKTLWDPKASSQKQVGIIEDDEGETAKFVIWKNSMKTCKLREGDRVKFEGIKVNVYSGQLALAVTSETTVRVLEEGDGPSRYSCKGNSWTGDTENEHSWVNGMVDAYIKEFTDLREESADESSSDGSAE